MIATLRKAMSSNTPIRPIVAVIGTTGVGKSQLAVSLAQSLSDRYAPLPAASSRDFNYSKGVVLSADSMQLYKGLDVITNKVTEDEKGGIEHWGLDVVTPGQGGSWEVGRWCGEAGKKVDSLESDTLPIICGGTHYFIQHFLFPPSELSFSRPSTASVQPSEESDPLEVRWKPPGPKPAVPEDLDPALGRLLDTFWTAEPVWPEDEGGAQHAHQAGPSRSSRPTTLEDRHLLALHALLAAIDAGEAGRWHWRDGRKVKRGLERWWERGGAIVDKTYNQEDGLRSTGRRARFRTLIFWVYEPIESLRPRLDKRVDRMVENGLLREIAEMREVALRMYGSSNAIDHSEGIFQSIGYKEFAYLPLPHPDATSDPRYPAMLSLTKSRTHQYAKSQLKWIRKQLLPAVREARNLGGEVEIFAVPGGAAGEGPARSVLDAFLRRDRLPPWGSTGRSDAASLLSEVYNAKEATRIPDIAARQVINSRRDCTVCSEPGRPFSLPASDWDAHLKSKIHQRNVFRSEGRRGRIIEEQLARRETVRAQREAEKQAKAAAVAQAEPT